MTAAERPPIEYTLWDAKTHQRISDDLEEGRRTGTLRGASDQLDKVHGELLDIFQETFRLVIATRRILGPGFAHAVSQLELIRDWILDTAKKVGMTRKAYEDYAEWFEELRFRVEPPKQGDLHTPVAWLHTDTESRDLAAREAAQRAREQMTAHERASDGLARSLPWFAPPPNTHVTHASNPATRPAAMVSPNAAMDTIPFPRADFGPKGLQSVLASEADTAPLPPPTPPPRRRAEPDRGHKVLGVVQVWDDEIPGIPPPVIGA